MPASVPFDRIRFTVSGTPGSGAVTVGSRVSDATNGDCLTPADAGIADGTVVTVCWVDGHSWEIGQSTYTVSGTSLSRDAGARGWNGSSPTIGNLSLSSATVGFIVDASAELSPVLGLNKEYTTTNPAAPASGARLFSRSIGGRVLPATVDAIGVPKELQFNLGLETAVLATAVDGSSTPQGLGTTPNAGSNGTATLVSASNSTYYTSRKRLKYVSAASANSAGGMAPTGGFFRGDSAGRGGWEVWMTGGIETYQSGCRFWMGVAANVVVNGSSDPSALFDLVGLGKDAADTNMQMMVNDGSGAATKVDTGFPANTGGADWYGLHMFCGPNAGTIYYGVYRLSSGTIFTGTFATNLPTGATNVKPTWGINTGAGSVAVAIAIGGCLALQGAT